MPGLPQVIEQISSIWKSPDREMIIEQADKIVELFATNAATTGTLLPTEVTIEKGLEAFYEIADPVYGGLKGEPKFPLNYQLEFLLGYARAKSDSRALFLTELTLDHMARGGIYDHLGGGFSRYSVDEKWLVPHFEKMLYDNALLASTYATAFRFTRSSHYQAIAEEILQYVLRDGMTSAQKEAFIRQKMPIPKGRRGVFTPGRQLKSNSSCPLDAEGPVSIMEWGLMVILRDAMFYISRRLLRF